MRLRDLQYLIKNVGRPIYRWFWKDHSPPLCNNMHSTPCLLYLKVSLSTGESHW